MRGRVLAMLVPGMLLWMPLHAQTASKSSLSEAELNGKKMFQQRCSICHTPPVPGSNTYGPMLSQDLVVEKEDAIRAFIMKGTAKMPGFQYGLEPKVIDEIIAYLKTVKKAEPKKQQDNKQPEQSNDI
jgi:mono/diheme cytochrome c family protein